MRVRVSISVLWLRGPVALSQILVAGFSPGSLATRAALSLATTINVILKYITKFIIFIKNQSNMVKNYCTIHSVGYICVRS